jgi:hypothetical protein
MEVCQEASTIKTILEPLGRIFPASVYDDLVSALDRQDIGESSGRLIVVSEAIVASPSSALNQQGRDIDFQLLPFVMADMLKCRMRNMIEANDTFIGIE